MKYYIIIITCMTSQPFRIPLADVDNNSSANSPKTIPHDHKNKLQETQIENTPKTAHPAKL